MEMKTGHFIKHLMGNHRELELNNHVDDCGCCVSQQHLSS